MSISIAFLREAQQHSQYDWVDLSYGGDRVGKARCRQSGPAGARGATFTVYSVNIYPEFAGRGYGREFIDYCKANFETVIADRVRFTAIGFWEAVGFQNNHDGNWVWHRS
jgi:GNAT superfamily N-acetyltransferase